MKTLAQLSYAELLERAAPLLQLRHLPDKHNQANHGRPRGGKAKPGGSKSAAKADPKPFGNRTAGRNIAGGEESKDVAKKLAWASLGLPSGGDSYMELLAEEQGFAGRPTVVSRSEMDKIVADGAVELHRGVYARQGAPAGEPSTQAELAEAFRSGPFHAGHGIYGNGTYVAEDADVAEEYSDYNPAGRLRMVFTPDARIIDLKDLDAMYGDFKAGERDSRDTYERAIYGEPGRLAMAMGVDAVRHPSPVSKKPGSHDYLVLNRTALVVEEAQ